jgi:hypothetical protein
MSTNPPNFDSLTTALSDTLNKIELFPIKAKGAVTRRNFAGIPTIEGIYHTALEQGRFTESSIADAMFAIKQKKLDLEEKITQYLDINKLAIDGQLRHTPRKLKFIADSIVLIKRVSKFISAISDLMAALQNCIGQLQSIEQNMLGMIQANLNALTNLIAEICNWGLPDLPALPNLFSDSIWRFNGWNFFPLGSFTPHVGLDTNFAFNQCKLRIPNINIFRNYPSSIQVSQWSWGTPIFVPPLGGIIADTNKIIQPAYITQLQETIDTPVYLSFNPNSSMVGSLPNPTTIISNFQLPPQTYRENIISLIPELVNQVILPSDSDYNSPPSSSRLAGLRAALGRFVTLNAVVNSNFDKNLTACWLFYLDTARKGRAGTWLLNFQAAYDSYIQPSLNELAQNKVPFNTVIGGTGVQNAPHHILFIDIIEALSPSLQQNVLWKLSYLEASLLGYPRSKTWDAGQDTEFLTSFTNEDLDYQATNVDLTNTAPRIVGDNEATYPVELTVPVALASTLEKVIVLADLDINSSSYQTQRPQFRFVYDAFAQTSEIDKFSQFWRDFNANLEEFLKQDAYVIGFVSSYLGSLDSAVNPLTQTADYQAVKNDALTRNRLWTPGTPLLNLPKAPVVSVSDNSIPTDTTSGWVSGAFNPILFMERPDIQALPISVQMAMLRTNLNYSTLRTWQSQLQVSVQNTISEAQAIINNFQNVGFQVEITANEVIVPVGTKVKVAFDTIDFDPLHFYRDSQDFVIPKDGTYLVASSVFWGNGSAGTRTIAILRNGTAVISSPSDIQGGGFQQAISLYENLLAGDVISIQVYHDIDAEQKIGVGSTLNLVRSETSVPDTPTQDSVVKDGKIFKTSQSLAPFTAITFNPSGEVQAIDPANLDVTPFVDGITISPTADDKTIKIGSVYGEYYQVIGSTLEIGKLLYVGLNGVLSQDYNLVVSQVKWLIVVGQAISPDTFIFQPYIPTAV